MFVFWRCPFYRTSNLPDRGAPLPSNIYHMLGPRLNVKYSLRHMAHPSPNFYRGGGAEVQILALIFD